MNKQHTKIRQIILLIICLSTQQKLSGESYSWNPGNTIDQLLFKSNYKFKIGLALSCTQFSSETTYHAPDSHSPTQLARNQQTYIFQLSALSIKWTVTPNLDFRLSWIRDQEQFSFLLLEKKERINQFEEHVSLCTTLRVGSAISLSTTLAYMDHIFAHSRLSNDQILSEINRHSLALNSSIMIKIADSFFAGGEAFFEKHIKQSYSETTIPKRGNVYEKIKLTATGLKIHTRFFFTHPIVCKLNITRSWKSRDSFFNFTPPTAKTVFAKKGVGPENIFTIEIAHYIFNHTEKLIPFYGLSIPLTSSHKNDFIIRCGLQLHFAHCSFSMIYRYKKNYYSFYDTNNKNSAILKLSSSSLIGELGYAF